jgi:hypothetical protein
VSSPLRSAVLAYVDARGWPHEVDPGAGIVTFPASGLNGEWTMYALADEDAEQLMVHAVFDIEVPPHRRVDLAVFLTIANFGLIIGNFELDMDDGELRYKTSIDVEGAELTEPLIDHLVMANVSTADRYLPGIRSVVMGEEPAAAAAAIESR